MQPAHPQEDDANFMQRYEVPWLRSARRALASRGRALQLEAAKLRQACSTDRAAYFDGLSREACVLIPRTLLRRCVVSWALNTASHTPRTCCLPFVNLTGPLALLRAPSPGGGESTLPHWCMEEGSTTWSLQLPSTRELTQALCVAPLRKAAGPDGIPNRAGRAQPSLLANCLSPLFLKLTVRGVEPAGFKGGHSCTCTSTRDLWTGVRITGNLAAFQPGQMFSQGHTPCVGPALRLQLPAAATERKGCYTRDLRCTPHADLRTGPSRGGPHLHGAVRGHRIRLLHSSPGVVHRSCRGLLLV